MCTSRERATSLERCQFPSRSARRIETLCSPERRRIACRNVCWSMWANLEINRTRGGRSLFIVELGALKACPGILTLDYLGEERTNSGLYGGRRSGQSDRSEIPGVRQTNPSASKGMLSKVEVR